MAASPIARSRRSTAATFGIAALLLAFAFVGATSAASPIHRPLPGQPAASLTIYPDGSVSTSGILSISGDVYSLSMTYTGAILDERNNSVLTGGGFAIGDAAYASAVVVYDAVNVSVDQIEIVSGHSGITVESSSGVHVWGNVMEVVSAAIAVNSSTDVNVSGNDAVQSYIGLWAAGDTGLTVVHNRLSNASRDAIDVYASLQVWIGTNDLHNATEYPLAVYSSTDVSAHANNMNDSGGMGMGYEDTTGGNISGNFFFGDLYPITLFGAVNATVWNNTVVATDYAVSVENSADILVGDTTAFEAADAAVYAVDSYGVSIVGADLLEGVTGVLASASTGISIVDSQLGYGTNAVVLENTSDVSITGSDLTFPNNGIVAGNSSHVTVLDSNLSWANYPIDLTGQDSDFLVENSDLSGAQIGAVYVLNSSGITIDHSQLRGEAAFAVQSLDTQGLTISNSDLSGTSTAPEVNGVLTTHDSNVNLLNDSITWTSHPFLDFASTGIEVAGTDLANETNVYAAISLTDDSAISVTSSNLSGATGDGLDANTVSDLVVGNSTFDQIGFNGIGANNVFGLTVSGSSFNGVGNSGIYADQSADMTISNVTANDAFYGFFFNMVFSTTITGSTARNDGSESFAAAAGADIALVANDFSNDGNGSAGIYFDATPGYSVIGNNLSDDSYGAAFEGTSNGPIVGNEFVNDNTSFWIEGNVSSTFYHNDFVNDQSWFLDVSGVTAWNSTYPVGGNFWSNYSGRDLEHGPSQNLSGADGIGDTPMVLNATTSDHYPLMAPWSEHQLVFVEVGLPAGTPWGVVYNGSSMSSLAGSIVIGESVGIEVPYTFTAVPVAGYTVAPASGNGVIGASGGTSDVVKITYTPVVVPTYPIVFTESGLPVGTLWSVTLNGVSETSTSTTVQFALENGSYDFDVGAIAGYSVAPGSGAVPVRGGPASQALTFSPILYPIDVVESGLPSGTFWSVTYGGSTAAATGPNVTRELANGSYPIVPSVVTGYTVTPSSTTLVVAGGPVTLYLVYTANAPSSNSPLPGTKLTPAQSTALFWGVIIVLAVVAAIGWAMAWRGRPARGGTGPVPGHVAGTDEPTPPAPPPPGPPPPG